jgi:mitogen-activated protein kinase kinase kinase 13
LYVQLDGQQTKSVAVQPATHGSGSMRKKMRHRRVGSGSLMMMPKASPNRDRRIQSEPETRAVKLVDTETQTDSMDISETDLSPTTPNPIPEVPEETSQPTTVVSTKREMTLCLRTDENNKQFVTVVQKSQSATLQSSSSSGESDIDDCVPQNEDTTSSSQTNNHLIMINSMATSIMTGSNLSYDSNDHLHNFRECSDDDNLETLGRKVSELISETTSNISTVSSTSTVINKNSTNNNIVSYSTEIQCKCISRRNSVCGLENDKNLNTTKCSCANESIDDEAGSWTDEDVDHQQSVNYSYSLRRKR